VVSNCRTEENDHEDDRTRCGVDRKESDEAYFGEVDAGHQLLEGLSVGGTFSVDFVCQNVEGVVADGEVDEKEPDGGEAQDEGRNNGVCNCLRDISLRSGLGQKTY